MKPEQLTKLSAFSWAVGLSPYLCAKALEAGRFPRFALVRLGRNRFVVERDKFFACATSARATPTDPELLELLGPTPKE